MKKNKFKYVFENGVYFYSKYMIAYALKKDENINDLGIIVSKKVGNSVVRHRYTRLIREVFRLNIDIKGYDFIIIAKKSILDKTFSDIKEDFERLIKVIKKYETNTYKIN